ncbi:ketopantoate reductase PanE/ApbA C terminal-domain-containing protein [Dunaliella salina]|uniref:Ketopantoate reductase PanE/ApbA C terminal-domain-containing protein n=1 Tax=Dunaliella salina TaxID=3046 RepID=A0ABQ7HA47_DUNSA|nr:ketopantoate reductase PanE/ApbA C terminal-domain-containing protein [Dunaliella salina]|eukprot:KAF5843729.1 ketopantoate reductase PanE/ApbA C terminal-domain-containing protein [Dunaliella salina]
MKAGMESSLCSTSIALQGVAEGLQEDSRSAEDAQIPCAWSWERGAALGTCTQAACADMELVQGNGSNISNLVISTKGNNVVDAVRSVQGRLLPASSIILIQNGMLAVYQELWNEILSGWDASSRPRIIVGTLTHGAYLTSRFHLFHSSYGKAILGCLNGKLLEDPGTQDAMQAVCNELHQVLEPNVYTTAQEMFQTVCKVAAATAQNKSSMLQDLSAGRPTELPFLNGFAVRQGLINKVPVPVNTLLHQLVSFRERHANDQS